MPKAKLEFNLPEEKSDLLLAQRGSAFFCKFWELSQEIRTYLKHGHNFKTPDEVLEWVRDNIPYSLLDDIE